MSILLLEQCKSEETSAEGSCELLLTLIHLIAHQLKLFPAPVFSSSKPKQCLDYSHHIPNTEYSLLLPKRYTKRLQLLSQNKAVKGAKLIMTLAVCLLFLPCFMLHSMNVQKKLFNGHFKFKAILQTFLIIHQKQAETS